MKHFFLLFSFFLFLSTAVFSQRKIYTSEDLPILDQAMLVEDCLQAMNKNQRDKTAVDICECQASKLNGRFSKKQYKQFTKKNFIDLQALIHTDSLLEKEIQDCYIASGKTVLLQAETNEKRFLEQCQQSIQASSDKTLDAVRVRDFCQCQLQLVKAKKISDKELRALHDPNSLLFFEMIYRCGDPFAGKDVIERNWTASAAQDVKGPAADTVQVATLNGMSYVKMKTGSLVQVWLFDTGASDLLINTEMEAALKKEALLTEANYLGTGEYEMANGTVDTCRRYRINNVQIGRFSVDNVVVSVSEKAKRIIVGKALLNKFSHWSLSNKENKLHLFR
ncbi:MAG TPA: retroviral-like aspartic protease family protein [Flavisolibacter sp.]|nr:retroviral-like aspartic protease family protein [Flavisolibacter sp.]